MSWHGSGWRDLRLSFTNEWVREWGGGMLLFLHFREIYVFFLLLLWLFLSEG